MARTVRRGRGRPKGTASKRTRLLDVATEQIATQRSVRLNLRELTRAADATPALLHYYFGNLEGLVTTLMQERGEPLLRPICEELQAHAAGAGTALSRFLQKWSSLIARQPWIACCLLRPVDADSTDSMAKLLRQVVAEAQREGTVRADLPADYIALLLLMLGSLPQYCGTRLGGGLELSAEPTASTQLTLLHLALLQRGIAARS